MLTTQHVGQLHCHINRFLHHGLCALLHQTMLTKEITASLLDHVS